MKSKVKENKDFAKWLWDWTAAIHQKRASAEHTLAEETARADGQGHSDGAHLFGPKKRAASGKQVA